MSAPTGNVVYVVACAAPPACDLHEFVALLRQDMLDVHVVTTPTAATWVDAHRIESLTGNAVRSANRQPDEARNYPAPDRVIVAPATFNTLNKWALGMNDNIALGVLHDALGLRRPVTASPYAKSTLTSHPAFDTSCRLLQSLGVAFTATNALEPHAGFQGYSWQSVIDALVR